MSRKPILFNTEMVRALLEDRKTVTRRVVRPHHLRVLDSPYHKQHPETPDKVLLERLCDPPYRPGDILYVRETWRIWKAHRYDADVHIEFKAGGDSVVLQFPHGGTDSIDRDDFDHFIKKWGVGGKWHPSIHMLRKAARLFLRVTNVRVERLQDITDDDCAAEGICAWTKDGKLYKYYLADEEGDYPACKWSECPRTPQDAMKRIWDSTIKKADRALYGWDADPWVWVIEFERISRE